MKPFILVFILASWASVASAQNKQNKEIDKKDLEAIRKDLPPPDPAKKKSILRVDDSLPVKIDTAALKPDFPQPTPPSPNNPNPHDPRPSVIHPNPPADPPKKSAVPPGTPTGPGTI